MTTSIARDIIRTNGARVQFIGLINDTSSTAQDRIITNHE